MSLVLERFSYGPNGTFGQLFAPSFSCFTVERPWLNNQPYISCIPEGDYPLARGHYNRGGYEVYEIKDVPNRSLIKIHIANRPTDVQGCIGLGNELGAFGNMWVVLKSTDTFNEFMMTTVDYELPMITIRRTPSQQTDDARA